MDQPGGGVIKSKMGGKWLGRCLGFPSVQVRAPRETCPPHQWSRRCEGKMGDVYAHILSPGPALAPLF